MLSNIWCYQVPEQLGFVTVTEPQVPQFFWRHREGRKMDL